MSSIWNSKYMRVLSIVLLVQIFLFYSASHGDSHMLKESLDHFPAVLPGGWTMTQQNVVDDATRGVLQADDVVSRYYSRAGLTTYPPELFIAFFSTQRNGQAPHSPRNCLPGAGWEPTVRQRISLTIPGYESPVTINKYIFSKGDESTLVLYWYHSHRRVVADEFAAKFYLVADSIRYHRSDTALVRISAPVLHNDIEGTLKNGTEFVKQVFPIVDHYLPM